MRKPLRKVPPGSDGAPAASPGRGRPARAEKTVPASLAAATAAAREARKNRPADLSGRTVGTWRVLYETELGQKRHCMCQCVCCGIRRYIVAFKLWKGYALRCRECRISRDLLADAAGRAV